MGTKFQKIITIIFGFIGIVFSLSFGYGVIKILFVLAKIIPKVYTKINFNLIISLFTAFVGVLIVVVQKHLESINAAKAKLREKKREIYSKYIKFWFDFLNSHNENIAEILNLEKFGEKEIFKFQMEFVPTLVLWGSDDVLRKFGEYMQMIYKEGMEEGMEENYKKWLLKMEEIMFAMRKDLGHKNKSLSTGYIWRINVVDIDQIVEWRE